MDVGAGREDPGRDPPASLRRTAIAYAELVRVPNLFTAPPDVLLGGALVAAAGYHVEPAVVAGLALASIILYAGGTTLNDAFDAPADEHDRPERPIPSGRVDRRVAFGLGVALLAAGVGVASLAAGVRGAGAAALIAVAIVLYDGALKDSAAGFLTMGTTRGLNVVLGTTVVALPVRDRPTSTVAVPIVVALYIATVTYMASRETEGGNRGAVRMTGTAAVGTVVALGLYIAAVRPPLLESALAALLAGAYLAFVGRPLRRAHAVATPETLGPAVGACVLGLVLLDAAFAVATGIAWGIATAAFLVPAVALSRVVAVT